MHVHVLEAGQAAAAALLRVVVVAVLALVNQEGKPQQLTPALRQWQWQQLALLAIQWAQGLVAGVRAVRSALGFFIIQA